MSSNHSGSGDDELMQAYFQIQEKTKYTNRSVYILLCQFDQKYEDAAFHRGFREEMSRKVTRYFDVDDKVYTQWIPAHPVHHLYYCTSRFCDKDIYGLAHKATQEALSAAHIGSHDKKKGNVSIMVQKIIRKE
jgi:hypothetical protein